MATGPNPPEDLVQYNDGFKTNLIGTPRQIAERIVALKAAGSTWCCRPSCTSTKSGYFGKHVLPLVRELEQAQAREAPERQRRPPGVGLAAG